MAQSSAGKRSVLFVCLGNTCRSTMAEAVMLQLVRQRGESDQWLVDSAGIADYHVGKQADRRTMTILNKHDITDYSHTVRQLTLEDYNKFDVIFGMDDYNMEDLREFQPKGSKAQLQMLGEWDPQNDKVIVDPYCSGLPSFEKIYWQCTRCLTAFISAQ